MTRYARPGRPKKYSHFIAALDDETCYTPGAIFANAMTFGLVTKKQQRNLPKARQRVRHTLARLAANHGFPAEGDGHVKRPGQCLTVGWFGKRWKSTLTEEEKNDAVTKAFRVRHS